MKLRNGLIWVLALLVAFCIALTGCTSSGVGKDTSGIKQTVDNAVDVTEESEEETQPTENTDS